MYGKNTPSLKKRLFVDGLKMGKNFDKLAVKQRIAKGTAEVYGIDGLAAGAHAEHEMLAKYLQISVNSFMQINGEITSNEDCKLHTIRAICWKSLATTKFDAFWLALFKNWTWTVNFMAWFTLM